MSYSGSRNVRACDIDEHEHIQNELQLIEELEQVEMEEDERLTWDGLDYGLDYNEEESLSCYGDWEEY